MRKRCFCTLFAVWACSTLIAAGNEAVILKSAASCFNLPAGSKMTSQEAVARFEKEAARGNAAAASHLGSA